MLCTSLQKNSSTELYPHLPIPIGKHLEKMTTLGSMKKVCKYLKTSSGKVQYFTNLYWLWLYLILCFEIVPVKHWWCNPCGKDQILHYTGALTVQMDWFWWRELNRKNWCHSPLERSPINVHYSVIHFWYVIKKVLKMTRNKVKVTLYS